MRRSLGLLTSVTKRYQHYVSDWDPRLPTQINYLRIQSGITRSYSWNRHIFIWFLLYMDTGHCKDLRKVVWVTMNTRLRSRTRKIQSRRLKRPFLGRLTNSRSKKLSSGKGIFDMTKVGSIYRIDHASNSMPAELLDKVYVYLSGKNETLFSAQRSIPQVSVFL